MRELETCYWLENHDRTGFDGVWMVSRYADVVKVLRSSQGALIDVKRWFPNHSGTHLITRYFSPTRRTIPVCGL